jgi:hypothetical protein
MLLAERLKRSGKSKTGPTSDGEGGVVLVARLASLNSAVSLRTFKNLPSARLAHRNLQVERINW